MSKIALLGESSVYQNVDATVNAANKHLVAGGGVCGEIFRACGYIKLTAACVKLKTPVKDGDAVITPAFGLESAKYVIHAVGPDFRTTPNALDKLFDAYYNSLLLVKENGLRSIAFPLISSGIFAGRLENPAQESTRQCCLAYKKFVEDFPDYDIEVLICTYLPRVRDEVQSVFDQVIG